MKKILVVLIFIALTISLSSCIRQLTYEDLLIDYQTDIEAREHIYQEYIDMYDTLSTQTIKSIVKITKTTLSPSTISIGSGFIFYEDATSFYVLTNHHVVYQQEDTTQTITVTDYLGKIRAGILVTSDESYDLAVVTFPKKDADLEVLSFSYGDLEFEDEVIVMGYPDGQINAITLGEFIDYDEIDISSETYMNHINFPVLVIDAPVKAGSSGSVVLNESYEIVGIVYAGNFINGSKTSEYAFSIAETNIFDFFDEYEILYESEASS